MQEVPTTVVIQRYLDALPGDPAAEPLIRELLDRAVGRLRLLCATHLYRSYPAALAEVEVEAAPSSICSCLTSDGRRMLAAIEGRFIER
jgi:hypothetical protein